MSIRLQGLESAFAASSSVGLPPLPRFGGLSELGCLEGFERDYELGEEIGSGSFGTVFVATSLHDGEEAAVKVRGLDWQPLLCIGASLVFHPPSALMIWLWCSVVPTLRVLARSIVGVR